MHDEGTDAKGRAEAISVALTVRSNTAGEPVWYAVWRDSGKHRVMRTVGPAWLVPVAQDNNVFVAKHEARERAKHVREGWRQAWQPRTGKGKAASGALDERQAIVKARALVLAREVERDDVRARIGRANDPRTFGALAQAWLAVKRAEVRDGDLKRSTLRDYEAMLRLPEAPQGKRPEPRAWIMRTFAERPPREITRDEIETFLDGLRDEHGLTSRTRHKYAVVLSMVFDLAREKGWTDSNPLAERSRKRKGKRAKKIVVVYSVEQVDAIARKAAGQDGEIIRLAAYTGLRQGELLALRWGAVDWTGSAIRVVANYVHGFDEEDTPKSDEARVVPMGRQAAEVLERISRREQWTGPDDLVFVGRNRANGQPSNVDPSALRKRYTKARDAVRAEDPTIPPLTFHGLRHTFGSRLAAAGVPMRSIQEYMGHADAATTAIYTHFVERTGQAAEITGAFDQRPETTGATVLDAAPVAV